MHCNGCGSDDAHEVVSRSKRDEKTKEFVLDEKGHIVTIETCNMCSSNTKDSRPRDAEGNIVTFPESAEGKYSYSTDKVHTSKREFSEHLKKNDLFQKG